MTSTPPLAVAEGVFRVPLSIVNAYLVAGAGGSWTLVDAGLSLSAARIRAEAARRFGPNAKPDGIVLTHGHFDHVGALRELAEAWDVPVYAHPLEMPYLTGRSPYPPPDPTVGGGAMALLSPLYSRGPIDLGDRVRPLPGDGSVPGLPGWRWVATPGHSPGHVSFFRDADRTLVAGDAFVTTKQESAVAALLKPEAVHGPPAYFTCDWAAAGASVRRLAELKPEVAATGHGVPMRGPDMRAQLDRLADGFERRAVPAGGRYARTPAWAGPDGVTALPPPVLPPAATVLIGAGAAVAAGYLLGRRTAG